MKIYLLSMLSHIPRGQRGPRPLTSLAESGKFLLFDDLSSTDEASVVSPANPIPIIPPAPARPVILCGRKGEVKNDLGGVNIGDSVNGY